LNQYSLIVHTGLTFCWVNSVKMLTDPDGLPSKKCAVVNFLQPSIQTLRAR